MKRLILDTSYLVAHFNERDKHHASAGEIADRFMTGEWQQLILVDAVFAETVTVLMARASYRAAKQVGEDMRASEELEWVQSSGLFDAAWHEFLVQPFGELSLVDCMLLVVADRMGVSDIATFDKAFAAIDRVRVVPSVRPRGTP